MCFKKWTVLNLKKKLKILDFNKWCLAVNLIDIIIKFKKILETKIKYLIYVSTPLGFNKKNINSILEISNLNNKKNSITGCLIYRSALYLQYLEGPSKELENTETSQWDSSPLVPEID